MFQEFDAGSLLDTCSTACQNPPPTLYQPRQGTSRPVQEFCRGKCSDWFGLYVGNKTVFHSISVLMNLQQENCVCVDAFACMCIYVFICTCLCAGVYIYIFYIHL